MCRHTWNRMEFVLRGAIVKSRNPDEGKDEVHPRTGHEATEEEERYSCLSLTLALDGGGRSMPHPGCFTPRKETRYPLYRRLGGLQGQSGWVWKTLPPPPGIDPQTVQPVANRCTWSRCHFISLYDGSSKNHIVSPTQLAFLEKRHLFQIK